MCKHPAHPASPANPAARQKSQLLKVVATRDGLPQDDLPTWYIVLELPPSRNSSCAVPTSLQSALALLTWGSTSLDYPAFRPAAAPRAGQQPLHELACSREAKARYAVSSFAAKGEGARNAPRQLAGPVAGWLHPSGVRGTASSRGA